MSQKPEISHYLVSDQRPKKPRISEVAPPFKPWISRRPPVGTLRVIIDTINIVRLLPIHRVHFILAPNVYNKANICLQDC